MIRNSQNVDTEEIRKFERLASQWWDRDGELKSLHDINPMRLGYIKSRVNLRDACVLDVGCGGGLLSESMAAEGARVVGIDMGADPLETARRHARDSRLSIEYRQETVETLAGKEPGRYDVVTCMELLEHVPDPRSVVAACGKLIKPGGDIFFATLNRNFKSFVFAIIGAEYVLRLLKRGTHQWRKFVQPEELDRWARRADLTVSDKMGMGYNPFSRRYYLTRDTSVNFFIHLRSSKKKRDTVKPNRERLRPGLILATPMIPGDTYNNAGRRRG